MLAELIPPGHSAKLLFGPAYTSEKVILLELVDEVSFVLASGLPHLMAEPYYPVMLSIKVRSCSRSARNLPFSQTGYARADCVLGRLHKG